jgi:hypothetical protein
VKIGEMAMMGVVRERITYVIVLPIILPLWLTLPDTKKQSCKIFPSPAGMSLTKLSLEGNTGKPLTFFLQYTLIKIIHIFLIYKEIHNGAVAKSYMTNGLLIYGEIIAHFLIY